jgi:serine/threonine-protein phosphatase 2A regulatory subunit B''
MNWVQRLKDYNA